MFPSLYCLDRQLHWWDCRTNFSSLLTSIASVDAFSVTKTSQLFSITLLRLDRQGLARAPSFDCSSVSMMFREAAFASMGRIYQKWVLLRNKIQAHKVHGLFSGTLWTYLGLLSYFRWSRHLCVLISALFPRILFFSTIPFRIIFGTDASLLVTRRWRRQPLLLISMRKSWPSLMVIYRSSLLIFFFLFGQCFRFCK